MAKDLLELGNPVEEILAAILKEWFGKEFSIANYSNLREDNFSWKSRDSWGGRWGQRRWNSGVDGQMRLFVAKWKLDWFTPWSLIQFIEKETDSKLWDVWSIDILREFSFINLADSDADFVLRKFKEFNSRKPLIVQAKQKPSGGSRGGWWFRWGWNRGGYRWGNSNRNRGGYKGRRS